MGKAYADAIMGAWNNPASQTRRAQDAELGAALDQPDGVLRMYRVYNAPTTPTLTYQSDFGATLVEPSPQAFGRRYLGYWETRNLRMVANILEVVRDHPGSRVLSIVGASHKPWFDGWLGQVSGVDIVEAQDVLKE